MVWTACQRPRRRQPGRVSGRNRQRALKGCCGSILDRRIDRIRRVDVISIVALGMALGVRVLRATAAGAVPGQLPLGGVLPPGLVTVAKSAAWSPTPVGTGNVGFLHRPGRGRPGPANGGLAFSRSVPPTGTQ